MYGESNDEKKLYAVNDDNVRGTDICGSGYFSSDQDADLGQREGHGPQAWKVFARPPATLR